MTCDEIQNLICELFLGGDTTPLDPDLDLLEEGICDSLGLVQIAAAIEKRVPGIKIRDAEIQHTTFSSIRKIEAFVAKKKAK